MKPVDYQKAREAVMIIKATDYGLGYLEESDKENLFNMVENFAEQQGWDFTEEEC